ncbi:outer membrane protein assembly factor BamB family protein [Anatilimnocola aggregata]|nr:PQQ-binding-like beta-propeller repeat protein [Anatilimnocola aggregata]
MGLQLPAEDWPQWRYDAQRSAATPHELPAKLTLAWSRDLPVLRPAWPDQVKMQLDAAYEPIVVGQRFIVGSSFDDSLTAYDTRTGAEVWRFFADAPIRFAPLAWQDKVYFAADDGYLYCLTAENGDLQWRFRGGPSDRKVLGNERLISTWPARGAPVLADGKIYFAAGIWPFMGIFVHAVDATNGTAVWTADGDGSMYIKQPHNTDSFAGVAPQGPLVAIGNQLLIPGGRSVPACYNRTTGEFQYYQLGENGKRGGGSMVAAVDQLLLNGGAAFDLKTEKYLGAISEPFAFAAGQLFESAGSSLKVHDVSSSKVEMVDTVDRKGVKAKTAKWTMRKASEVDSPRFTAMIKAGSRLYGGGEGQVIACSLPRADEEEVAIVWQAEVKGTIAGLIAADDRLFFVTREGQIACFAEPTSEGAPTRHFALESQRSVSDAEAESKAAELLKSAETTEGYALAWGVGSGELIKEVVRQSSLRVIVLEADVAKAHKFRQELRSLGVPGDRLSVIVADPRDASLPPYFASLVVAESLPQFTKEEQAAFVEKTFNVLRPYGGIASLSMSAAEQTACENLVKEAQLPGAEVEVVSDWLRITRAGALPESANWTHEHADAANSRVSKDKRVKAPLGLLWFGGSTNDGILPRHGHGPQPQVVDGRLFIEGVDMLRAMDIYTGRILWNASLPGIGALYNNTAHQPGANASGTNYIATPEGVYVAYRDACLKLDPATGKTIDKFQLPLSPKTKRAPLWGYLNVYEDYLIGGADPVYDPSLVKKPETASKTTSKDSDTVSRSAKDNDNYSASNRLVVMNRKTGKELWSVEARSGFRHNGICIGGGRLYCIDRLSGPQVNKLKRRGENPPHAPRIIVLDLQTGTELWTSENDVFGTWLSYSTEHDMLVEAGRTASDTLSDEPKGMRVYRGKSGQTVWTNKSYSGPAMIHHETILMAGKACSLLTGDMKMREHPLSGESVEWTWSRNYGCNTPMASENLLTFRSGAAGYFDLCNDSGTGNFGGFRSSCTNNLVVAGGILTAPDYTRTCVCSYQNQTSIALVPVDDAEVWTSFGSQTPKQPVRRVGINFGAPGDRKAEDGTLWLEYPSIGGSSPALDISIKPAKVEWYRRHSSQIEGQGLNWVVASGVEGLTSVKVKLGTSAKSPRIYTVRLHFAELNEVLPGERAFSVSMQGKEAIASVDVVRDAEGKNRSVVKEVKGVRVGDDLLIELTPHSASKWPTLLSGIEIQAED